VLQTTIETNFSDMSLTLVRDAAVSKGGCLVESAGTVVDGTVQKRWRRTVANLGLTVDWDAPDEPI
jgi:flagellar assembly protein FliH